MKISLKSRLIINFISIIIIIFSLQFIFNIFFAKDIYVSYKSSLMEEAFYSIKENYNPKNISDIASAYEDTHNMQIIVKSSREVIYTSFDRILNQHITNPIISKPKLPYSGSLDISETPKTKLILDKGREGENLVLQGKFTDDTEIVVLITLPIASIEKNVDIFNYSSIVISLIAIFITIITSIIISNRAVNPIKNIQAISHNYATLDFSKKANERTNVKEIAELSKSINSMAVQLEKNINNLNLANKKLQEDIEYKICTEKRRKQFIANISHEMKTPLALLQVYAENLNNKDLNIDKTFYIDTILEETQNLNDMITKMLDVSSVENGYYSMNFESISMSDVCSKLMSKFNFLLSDFNTLIDINDDLYVNADFNYINEAMTNYINNAISYTKKGDSIKIKLYSQNDKIIFSVYNQGSKISEEDLPYIWDSFYKADKSRNRSSKNIGIGLYVVHTIIEKHNGKCNVYNRDNGVEFDFELPKFNKI